MQARDLDLLLGAVLERLLLPPGHVGRLLDQVVAHPAGQGHDREIGVDELLLPADLDKHVLHLAANLGETLLAVGAADSNVHLVDTDDQMLHSEQVNQAGVLAGLALDLTELVVTLLDGGGEVTIGGDHEQSDVSLSGAGDHVLDKIPVTGGIDHGVVPLVGEELLGGAGDGHTTLTLLLLPVHVESKGERGLAEALGLSLELLHLTLGYTTEGEEQVAGGGRLSGVNVTADDDRHVILVVSGRHD